MPAQTPTSEEITPQRGSDVDKRQAIVEAARDLFTTAGYENTTIAQVAGRAGVGVGTVYLYFKNKNDILVAVKSSWELEVVQAIMRPDLAALLYHLRTRPMIEAVFAICARHTEMVQLMGLQAELVGEWTSQPPVPIRITLKAFLDEAVAAGALRPVDTERAAVVVYGMVNSALLQCFVVEGGTHQSQYIDTLVDALEHWLFNPTLLQRSASHS